MGRVAIVTGGTRGIGEAISVALKEANRTVVASYVGNESAARAFSEATGIRAVKFDVCSFEACEDALAGADAADLAGVALDDGLSEGDLAVPGHRHMPVAPHAQDGCPVPPDRVVRCILHAT